MRWSLRSDTRLHHISETEKTGIMKAEILSTRTSKLVCSPSVYVRLVVVFGSLTEGGTAGVIHSLLKVLAILTDFL
ncbi:hypothetical protein AGOR_G00192600 [Albula goreensis]|uniref:Uncharacterized protein n=1 Tax=Albula goreensis TaxID=1534307 RepID=A0A8T3CV85_9TELE|nr:hypothetical protein AGOR_G00192600 [Albula goreensis]